MGKRDYVQSWYQTTDCNSYNLLKNVCVKNYIELLDSKEVAIQRGRGKVECSNLEREIKDEVNLKHIHIMFVVIGLVFTILFVGALPTDVTVSWPVLSLAIAICGYGLILVATWTKDVRRHFITINRIELSRSGRTIKFWAITDGRLKDRGKILLSQFIGNERLKQFDVMPQFEVEFISLDKVMPRLRPGCGHDDCVLYLEPQPWAE